jgi:hypothetical protein
MIEQPIQEKGEPNFGFLNETILRLSLLVVCSDLAFVYRPVFSYATFPTHSLWYSLRLQTQTINHSLRCSKETRALSRAFNTSRS